MKYFKPQISCINFKMDEKDKTPQTEAEAPTLGTAQQSHIETPTAPQCNLEKIIQIAANLKIDLKEAKDAFNILTNHDIFLKQLLLSKNMKQ